MRTQLYYSAIVMLLIQGCSNDASIESSESQVAGPADPRAMVGMLYQHTIERSRFRVGDQARHEVEGPYDRLVGSRGVFFRDTVTNAVLAVPNATPTELLPRPLTESAEQHSKFAAAYLLGAGIPAKEVSGTHVTTTMSGSTDRGTAPSGNDRLLWYTTHLERTLGGIPVESSFAFAAFDSSGEVIEEGVHWPAIPADVLADALALKQQLSTPDGRAGFLAAVEASQAGGGAASAGEVKIVHSPPTYHGRFEARAVYTVVVPDKDTRMAHILRFDGAANRVQLAYELEAAK